MLNNCQSEAYFFLQPGSGAVCAPEPGRFYTVRLPEPDVNGWEIIRCNNKYPTSYSEEIIWLEGVSGGGYRGSNARAREVMVLP